MKLRRYPLQLDRRRAQLLSRWPPHLRVIPVERHDGPEEEEGEVEVVLEQVGEFVVAVLLLAVLQAEAHAAHDAEAAAAVEQDVLEVEGTGHQGLLEEQAGKNHSLETFRSSGVGLFSPARSYTAPA